MKIRRNPHHTIPFSTDWNIVKQQTYNFLLERHRKIRRPYKAAMILHRIGYREYRLSLLEN